MKSKIVISIFIIIGGVLIYFLYGILRFNLGDDFKLLRRHKYKDKINIDLYYIPSNATSCDYIQVRIKEMESEKDTTISFERYNYIVNSRLNDTLLELVLKDTSIYHIIRKDTFIININDCLKNNRE